jgi:hypothetical protein
MDEGQGTRGTMLGDKLGGITGSITFQRVIRDDDGEMKLETSFRATGTLLGVDVGDVGTYVTVVRADGTQYSEGRGIMTTNDGRRATWTGHGLGRSDDRGGAGHRGSLCFQTMPDDWARLSGVLVLLEYGVAADGTIESEYWEWK